MSSRLRLFAALPLIVWTLAGAGPTHAIGSPPSAMGIWSKLPPPHVNEAPVLYDTARQRLLVFGGEARDTITDDVWTLNLTGSPGWTKLVVSGPRPAARAAHAAMYDAQRDRLLIFGGRNAANQTLNDVWELPFGTLPLAWHQATTTGTPPTPRAYTCAVYDSANDRAVFVGGAEAVNDSGPPSSLVGDVWTLSLSGAVWTQLLPTGTGPGAIGAATSIYDGSRQRMVLACGFDGASFLTDTWQLELDASPAWSTVPAVGPPPARAVAAGIYDPPNDRMVIYGGVGEDDTTYADVWELPFATNAWNMLSPTGGPPTPHDFGGAAYDLAHRRMLLYSGFGPHNTPIGDVAWALSLDGAPQWTALSIGPAGRYGAPGAYDPVGDRLIVFGGFDGTNWLSDTWALTVATGAWNEMTFSGSAPSARTGHSAIYDPVRNRVVVFGGNQGMTLYGQVWALSLTGTPSWTLVSTTGGPPAARTQHVAVYDSKRDRMIVHGGQTTSGVPFADTWALDFATDTWSEVSNGNPGPAARALHAGVYDDRGDRLIVYSGYGLIDDLWALSLAGTPTWSSFATFGAGNRYGAAAAYDTSADVMLYFGGAWSGGGEANNTWLLRLRGTPAWSSLSTPAPLPDSRDQMAVGYDQVGARLIVFGGTESGNGNSRVYADTWVLNLDRATPVLASILSANARAHAVELAWSLSQPAASVTIERREADQPWSAIGAAASDGSGRLGFVDRSAEPGHRYAYRLAIPDADGITTRTGEAWVDVPLGPAIELAGFAPNPARGEPRLVFSLASGAPARLELLDVTGRRVLAREVGGLGEGRHTLSLAGIRMAPGIYVARLTTAGAVLSRRAVLVP